MELNDEQIAKLTPEQITEYEDNPEAREKILASLKSDEETEDTPEQEEEDAANGEGEEEESEEEEQAEPEQEDEPVVLTKSGKGIIPYEKHKELRMEVATLRDKLAGMEKTKAELETLKAKIREAGTPGRRADIQKKLEERIATMKEDFPDIGNSMDDFNQMFSDLVQQIESDKAEAKAKAEEEAQLRVRTVQEQVQEAKENNPDLMHWEAHDEDAWNEAMMQDEILRNQPKWARKSYEERFAEVVKRVRAIMPDASEPKRAEPPEKTREKAKAKLEKAVEKKPTTLSDIQGGGTPMSERDQIENLSPHELAAKLMRMPAQQQAALRAELD